MVRRLLCFLSIIFCLQLGISSAQSFTLEQVMSAPFSSDLKAALRGDRFVWIADQEGKRNLWLAEADKPGGAYRVRELTHDDSDDGQDVGEIAWAPDASAIAYVRGGDFEFPEKPAPNPALIPAGVKQEIWLVPAAGGEPSRIAEGRQPAISPDGGTLAYIWNDQVWTVKLGDAGAKPEQLFHGRGKEDSLRWSPDGHALAFVSHRDDHSFVGVYSLDTNQLHYMAPGTYLDREPSWSPDGHQLAFLRVPPDVHGYIFGAQRSGAPWSIVVADATTGNGREIWHAHAGMGSVFHDLEMQNQIAWGAENRIVFPWEADGWSHIYSIAATGGVATLLTPGAFEVEYATLSPDGKTVVYSSNQYSSDPEDADRRHIWTVSVRGGVVQQRTSGAGIEVAPTIASDGTIAVLHADARMPMRPAVLATKGQLLDVAPNLIPASFPASKLVVPQQVIFNAADGIQLHGQIFMPSNASDGKRHPAIVFFHGGSRRQMLLGWNPMEYYTNSYAENQYLTSLGYIVLSVNYRSGIGYGLNFREALDYGPTGASEFNDVLGAGLYLRNRVDVDGSRIGVWGGSYGGYLTALALARASDLFAAGVDMHGVHDWNLEMSFAEPRYRKDMDQQAASLAWQSSPMSAVKTWRSPVLLMQGDDDRNVQFSQTVQLAEMLREQGTPVEEHIFPDEIHEFLLHRTWVAAYRYEADFFNRYLKNQPPR